MPYVLVHNHSGVKIGIEYLIQKGYSKIAFVTVDLDQIQMHQREQGYIETIKHQGFNYLPELVLKLCILNCQKLCILICRSQKLKYEQPKDISIAQIATFIQNNPIIEAVFFSTNYLGICGLESIEQLHLKIPDDIAVVCFDDHDIFRIFRPGITIIEQPIEEIAKVSIEMLINTIDEVPFRLKDYQVIKEPALIIRGSA